MRSQFRDTVRRITKRLGIHRGARFIYNKVFLWHATRDARIDDLTCTFGVPSLTVADYVDTFTGEKKILSHFLGELRPGDIVWDVGAAFGVYTLFAARKLEGSGTVIAFEPEPRMRRLLERNCRLNNLANVLILPFALGEIDSTVLIYPSDTPNVGTSALVQRTDYRLKKRGTSTMMHRGSSLAARHSIPPPTILKVDVEGAEGNVLSGCAELLRSPALRLLYCEVHPHLLPMFDTSEENLERQIREAGFRIVGRHKRGTEFHLVCNR